MNEWCPARSHTGSEKCTKTNDREEESVDMVETSTSVPVVLDVHCQLGAAYLSVYFGVILISEKLR